MAQKQGDQQGGEDQDKRIEEIVQMEMKRRQARFDGFQEMNKANQEGFNMANQSHEKNAEVREQGLMKRSDMDGTDLSKEVGG